MISLADPPRIRARCIAFNRKGDSEVERAVPVEAPVAIEYSGIGYAVFMATPSNLEDFAIGFTLTEGIVASASEIEDVVVAEAEGGFVLRVALPAGRLAPIVSRARTRISESGCGLCGIDTIAQALRPLPSAPAPVCIDRDAIATALSSLPTRQPLGQATGAAHAAAFCGPDGRILVAREDVGRHNALDKLVGALAVSEIELRTGFILLTARCSYELVEKAVRAGSPMLVTISAPTSLAVERAAAAGLTLVVLARQDSALVLSDTNGSIV